jgi:signal transduction histidine kinase
MILPLARVRSNPNTITDFTFFAIMAFAWAAFVQSAYKFQGTAWFYYLISVRVALFFGAALMAILILFKPIRHAIARYAVVCMIAQSSFAILEGPESVFFYEYIPYFSLISALTLRNRFSDWIRKTLPLLLATMIAPLFFKDAKYFDSIGTFIYTFTTPFALFVLSIIVARISSGRFEALERVIELKEEMLRTQAQIRTDLEFELRLAKEKIKAAAKESALFEVSRQLAHDIRSPVAALSTAAGAIKEGVISEEVLQLVESATLRIRDIANNILYKKKRKERDQPLTLPIIADIIDEALVEKKYEFFDKVSFCSEIGPLAMFSGRRYRGSTSELARIISNLMNNAAEAASDSPGSQVRVRALEGTDHFSIVIEDNGPGISDKVLETINSGISITTKPQGSGLGLVHARSVLSDWGGSLDISTNPRRGTSLTVRLGTV